MDSELDPHRGAVNPVLDNEESDRNVIPDYEGLESLDGGAVQGEQGMQSSSSNIVPCENNSEDMDEDGDRKVKITGLAMDIDEDRQLV